MELKPWKVLRSETVYSLPPYLTVHSHSVELPDGQVIEPYFRIDLRSWVVMLAITADRDVVVARQYRHGIGRESLMLPGGLLEEGEDPLDAAKRELMEETGFASDSWESLGHFIPNSNYRCGECHLFLAREAKRIAEPDSDDLEETELCLMPFVKLLDELRQGNVISLSTVTAIALAQMRLSLTVLSH